MKIIVFFVIIISVFLNSYELSNCILQSFSLCTSKLFPSIIPFMLLSNILIEYNFTKVINKFFKPLMKLFQVNENIAFPYIMGILVGTPTSTFYLKELFDKKLITIKDLKQALNFCHFISPLFIINTVGILFLNSKKLGIIIFISGIISSIVIGIITRNNYNNHIEFNIPCSNKKNFITILSQSIVKCASNLILIMGVITFISCILTILKLNNSSLSGIFEITIGLNNISNLNINNEIKTIIISSLISFGGFSIHAQNFSILENKKIRYKPYLKSRILHCIISGCITFLIIKISNF